MSLLSNFEMGRLNLRRGKNKNELVVEVDTDDQDQYAELVSLSALPHRQVLQTTRIGVLEHTPKMFSTDIL